MPKDYVQMAKKRMEKAKATLKGKEREQDKFEKIFTNTLLGQPLTPTQQLAYDRYLLIINYRLSGITGRLLLKMLRDDKRELFKDITDNRIHGIISESLKVFGTYNDIDKQAERMLLAGQFDEIALKIRKEGNYELCLKYMAESAKLKGLYDSDSQEKGIGMPKNILSDDTKAKKQLTENTLEDYDADTV